MATTEVRRPGIHLHHASLPSLIRKMVPFLCTRCGRCCMSLGRQIRIERSSSSTRHYCRVALTGEVLPVTIHPAYRDLFSQGEQDPAWCPFLRKEQEGRFACTIHATRPRLCREFRCRTMVIYDRDAREAGYVKGRRSLVTADADLTAAWKDLPVDADTAAIIQALSRRGYRAEPLE